MTDEDNFGRDKLPRNRGACSKSRWLSEGDLALVGS